MATHLVFGREFDPVRPVSHSDARRSTPTATGKSKFTGAIKDVLGDYAMQTAFETFLAKRWGGGASNDIADLAGARLVLATEADRGRRFAEATLKQLTGGDTVRARQLYEKNFEFKPQFAHCHAHREHDQCGPGH